MDKKKQPTKKKVIQAETAAQRTAGEEGAGRPMVNIDAGAGKMRRQAEKIARKDIPDQPEDLRSLSPEATEKLLHELRIHQIELQAQNEELQTAQVELEKARAQYFELYDMAPVGYFSISEEGMILEANIAGANLLGVPSRDLRALPFSKFIIKEDQDIYYLFRRKLFETLIPQASEMRMVCRDGSQFWAQVQADLAKDVKGRKPVLHVMISDITERKRAEEALRESEAQKFAILNGISTNIALVDKEFTILWANKASGDSVNKRPEDMVGHPCYAFWGDTVKPCADCPTVTAFQTGQSEHKIVQTPDGRIWDEGGEPVFDAAGNVIAVVEIAQDITERKKTDEKLKESEDRFRRLSENALDVIYKYRMKPSPNFEYVSPASVNITGYAPEEYYADPFLSAKIVHPEDRDRFKEYFSNLESLGKPLALRWIHKDGHVIWYEEIDVPVYNEEGKLVALEGIVRDITERKKAEESVRESEGRFKSIIEHISDIFYMLDSNYKMLYISPQAEKTMSFTLEEVRENWRKSVTDNPINLAAHEKTQLAFTTGEKQEPYLQEFMHRDGTRRLIEINESPLKNDQGEVIGIVGAARDITENKKAENELRESEERFRNMTNLLPQAVFETDETSNFTFVNRQGFEMFGYSEADIAAGMSVLETIIPPDRDRAVENIGLRISGKESPPQEYTAVRKDGSKFPAKIYAAPIITDSGYAGMRGILIDITDLKIMEYALKESEAQYRLLAEHMTDTVWLMDMQLKTTYQSPSAEKLRGYKPEEIQEMPPEKHVTPESLKLVFEILSKEIPMVEADMGYNPIRTVDLEYYRKDGTTVWAESKFSVIRDESGKPVSILAEARDITERKQMEEALKESEAKYRDLFEESIAVVYVFDNKKNFIDTNQAGLDLVGYSREELLNMHISDVDAHYEAVLQAQSNVLSGGRLNNFEHKLRRKDGAIITVLNNSRPLTDPHGTEVGILSTLIDITDRKRLEEEQQRVAKLESVGVLAGGIAHDFNNILTSIMGNISLASMEAQDGSELQNSLQQAEKASQRAKDLTKQLLTFSKGGAPVTSLASLTELLKDTTGFALRGTNVKCHFSIPADLWHAEIDAGQISQIIQNLVINAQQAMQSGGTIEVTAENMALDITQSIGSGLPIKEGNYIRIAVADHGSGISAEHLDKIFDPFFTTKQAGSGLGLATSFSIARNHGGHLSVESEVGSGSTFYLYLPASLETVTPNHAKTVASKPADKSRILVMDDEPGVREIAGRMLKHIGYKDIEFAKDGAEAIKLYKAAVESGKPFSVVILDLTISGGMGSKETVKKLLKMDPGVKAIVSSGYIDNSVITRFRDYGFSGMVAKPYTIAELRKAVQDVIG